ncbi:hypothetical protein A1F97_10211 [Pyrenophora tritici-repentis]|nr:hypothetical protein A1F97_10211 [Pyrenophora tritici-repentis]
MERPDADSLLAASAHAHKKPSYEPRKQLQLTPEEAHIMWGHAGRQAIDHLPRSVDGLQLVDGDPAPKWKNCEICIQSKLTKLVSRRPPREPATRPFERISIDLRLLAKIERQYDSQVVTIRLDMEAGYVELLEICRDLGIALEPRATEAQNGGIERAGKSIVIRGRAIRLHAGLPKEYANECVMSAIYLLNRTPVEAIDWRCPYTKVKGVKPSVAHLEVIGARAYVLNEKLPRGAKLDSRALIGHLVGFDSTNIFRVWLPSIGRVIRTRDVVFVRSKLCDGQGQYAEKSYVREIAEQGSTQQKTTTALMTPDATPESPELTQLTGESLTDHLMDDTSWGRGYALAPEGEEPDRTSNNAARREEISSQVSEQFIVKGKRFRKPVNLGTYLATFAACINPTAPAKLLSEAPKIRLHRDQLPAEPKRWKDLDQHPFGAEFKKASRKEINGCSSLGSAETEPLFYGASDAAFADDLPTRRSSQGYLFMLYGMPIDWKATLQRSVTKSTTEAELLALSTAASELQAWNRLFKHIKLDLEMVPTIYCDNLQTVGVVTKHEDKLFTRLRHVDVHQHWLRQEVADGRISVQWKPTNLMPADGLTKILVRQKHAEFVRQLGLRDVKVCLLKAEGLDSPDPASLTHWY